MPSSTVISSLVDIGSQLFQAVPMPKARKVMMVSPRHFDIQHAINPHMQSSDGKQNVVNKALAEQQWRDLKATYEKLGLSVSVLEGVEALPDMVFCANQCLPSVDSKGQRNLLMSNMADDTRHKEVEPVAAHLKAQGYECRASPKREPNTRFEGMGDCLWIPGKRFLICGTGTRTSPSRMADVSEFAGAPIVPLELVHPRFYHLDTCLCILNQTTAIVCKSAFSEFGWSQLQAVFPSLIEASLSESDSPLFACNAHCPDEKHVIIQKGNRNICEQLRDRGFVPIEVETGEFIKSGGSVFCMKLMYF